MEHKKWEYLLIKKPITKDILDLDIFLQRIGKDGWEMCGSEYGAFIFKRAILQQPEQ